ncbi:MAG: ATP-binding cassette domain-containing protein [Lachnospiraceae bacterium]|nr:ATP-binding cassette domain-containing protein [Lachnospiraceae bacterium]
MQEIIVDHVSLEIKNVKLLKDIQLTLHSGNVYGLRGRNGSGKTVLMKCICGFMKPTQGTISVNGKLIHKDMDFLPSAGIMIEEPGFFPNYSGFKNLKILAGIQNRITDKEIRKTMELVGLDPSIKKAVGKYSLGMRQRLGIAQAMMEQPDISVLDEPTNGLDEDGVEWFRQFILKQKESGKLILIASHSKEDIELLSDEVYYMEKGVLSKV